jgi:lysosomal alpha-mannosidase
MYDGFNTNKTFWTDSNGLEMQKRVINHRDTFDVVKDTKQNISSNFYPVTSAIVMRDVTSNK